MATLAEVAQRAQVSTATASLVLSGKAEGRVSSATASRVRAVSDELGYVRDALAGSLRSRRTSTIGVLAEQVLSTPYAVAMIEAILAASRELGWSVLLTDSGGHPEQTGRAVREFRSRRVDAVLYAAMYHQEVHVVPGPEAVAVLNGFADRDDVVGVVPDEEGATRAAVTHLLALGHRRIGHITHDDPALAVGLRRAAYLRVLREAGIGTDTSLVVSGGNDPDSAEATARRLLERRDRPTAVFCYNDGMAAGVYRAAASLGLSVPEDLSVVGFDDLRLISTNLAPALTTLRLPHYEMADWLVRRLVTGDLPDPPAVHRFPCELFTRGSTAAPRVGSSPSGP
ncbi:LacI family DNA-binding transcriptional regulator [Actinomyces sp. 2119]|uniref:LacI family DNA-binding transcriptional regulator n=1 Tax=Actinomyces sp. 2119 TaxID=2321393 RepID=UPI000E6B85AA|nr:LacI family DNA-binding transcriptional regulator [Actinomyces sp. 2119]RJF44647.1 LacI family DNA-binding transcriptional regulator [Actinomyces sp. 2119]